MPQEHERHSKNAWEWMGNQPSRSQQRDAAAHDDPAHSSTPSKVKKGKCKGPDGWHAEHELVFVRERDHLGREIVQPCSWKAAGVWQRGNRRYKYVPKWTCTHEERCARCNHLERASYELKKATDCPDYAGQPVPDDVTRDCEYKQAESDRRHAAWIVRRAAAKSRIKGPQGYRKAKPQKE